MIRYELGAPPPDGASHETDAEVVPAVTAVTSVTVPGAGVGVKATSTQ